MPEAVPTQALIAVRDAGPGDLGFILKSWLLTLRNGSSESWHVENQDFFAGEQVALKRVLARARALVAHPAGDPDLILGFLVHEPPDVAHFVYVKAALRRQGVARMLLQAAGLDPARGLVASTLTHDLAKGWIRAKWPAIRRNPYLRRNA